MCLTKCIYGWLNRTVMCCCIILLIVYGHKNGTLFICTRNHSFFIVPQNVEIRHISKDI
jgi:hypothetical protein